MNGNNKSQKNVKNEIGTGERIEYTDHMTEIIRQAEKDGLLDDLPGKGKPLKLDNNYFNNPDKQLYKILKDNNVLPRWIELRKEIDSLKEKLTDSDVKVRLKLIKDINKKIKEYNYACPSSLQKNKVDEGDYL